MPEFEEEMNYDPPEGVCRGLFYRASKNFFVAADGRIEQRFVLRPLKSLSCPGCRQCACIEELVSEYGGVENLDLTGIRAGETYEIIGRVSPGSYEYPDETDAWAELREVPRERLAELKKR